MTEVLILWIYSTKFCLITDVSTKHLLCRLPQCGVVINNNTDVSYSLTPQDTLVLLATCAVLIITKDFTRNVLCPGLCSVLAYLAAGIISMCHVPLHRSTLAWDRLRANIKHRQG